jgi:hypothetical protein
MIVYHRYDGMTESSIWIIIQPIAAACKLPSMLSASITHSPVMLHCFLFRSTSQSWKAYLKYLEGEVRNDVCLSFIAVPHSVLTKHFLKLESSGSP